MSNIERIGPYTFRTEIFQLPPAGGGSVPTPEPQYEEPIPTLQLEEEVLGSQPGCLYGDVCVPVGQRFGRLTCVDNGIVEFPPDNANSESRRLRGYDCPSVIPTLTSGSYQAQAEQLQLEVTVGQRPTTYEWKPITGTKLADEQWGGIVVSFIVVVGAIYKRHTIKRFYDGVRGVCRSIIGFLRRGNRP